jgi:integrase
MRPHEKKMAPPSGAARTSHTNPTKSINSKTRRMEGRWLQTAPTLGSGERRGKVGAACGLWQDNDARVEIRDGTHIARSKSVTWPRPAGIGSRRPRQTAGARQRHGLRRILRMHIAPFIGSTKLSDLSVPLVRALEDQLRENGRSTAMVRRTRNMLSMLLSDALERGLATRNVARGLTSNRTRGKERQQERRHKGKLKVGIDIPAPDEIGVIVSHLTGRWRPLLLTAIFCGLRASELRGLRWIDIDLDRRELHVRQRADRFKTIGAPKSASGERTVPMLPFVVNALKEWRLACPKSELGLVFPNPRGVVEDYNNIVRGGLLPTQFAAGVTVDGKAKYTGLHCLRHFYASSCINRKADGGLELPAKVVQERLGHSTISQTLDTYGHLFPRGDDRDEMEAAQRAFLGS